MGKNGLSLCKTNASGTERFIFLLNQMYKWLTLLHNHFIPSMRITSKERITGKIHKTNDTQKPPILSQKYPTIPLIASYELPNSTGQIHNTIKFAP